MTIFGIENRSCQVNFARKNKRHEIGSNLLVLRFRLILGACPRFLVSHCLVVKKAKSPGPLI